MDAGLPALETCADLRMSFKGNTEITGEARFNARTQSVSAGVLIPRYLFREKGVIFAYR
jgi:hypothetical protein